MVPTNTCATLRGTLLSVAPSTCFFVLLPSNWQNMKLQRLRLQRLQNPKELIMKERQVTDSLSRAQVCLKTDVALFLT